MENREKRERSGAVERPLRISRQELDKLLFRRSAGARLVGWSGAMLAAAALLAALALVLSLVPERWVGALAAQLDAKRAAAESPVLELLSLSEEREGEQLLIQGSVRNISLHTLTGAKAIIRRYQGETLVDTTSVPLSQAVLPPGAEAYLKIRFLRRPEFDKYHLFFAASDGRPLVHRSAASGKAKS